LVHPPQHRMHIDYAHSITLGRNKELYYLIIVIDSIDFKWAQPSPNRSKPEYLIHDFIESSREQLERLHGLHRHWIAQNRASGEHRSSK
jgi:hypothetical protein